MVEDEPRNEEERELFETSYFELVAKSKKLINHSNEIINNASTSTSVNESSKSDLVKLPRIHLPEFAGSSEQWLEFYNIFNSLVHKNNSLNNFEKNHYLKAYLKQDAATLIHALEVSANNYNIV